MRISFMTWCVPTWSVERLATFAGETAYDGVELRVDRDHGHGVSPESTPEERQYVRELFRERDVEISGVATSVVVGHDDPEKERANVEDAKANVRLASDLGAGVIRTFAGGDVEELTPSTAAELAATFTEFGRFGEQYGVCPVVEMHGNVLPDAAVAVELADRVETPNFGLLWNQTAIDESSVERMGDYLRHVHLKEPALDPEYEPLGTTVRLLEERGYRGYLSLEIERGEDQSAEILAETAARIRRFSDGV